MSDTISRLNAALDGRYRVERMIGEGGMATVYLANDLRHERSVAVKVLKPELAAVVGAERFLAEIKTTASLQHPHILPLFDSGKADTFLFFVMPYVEGESLRHRLDHEKQLAVKDALAIAKKVSDALDYAHEQGVVHRDIKPGNILLGGRGEPLVTDFGIALAVAQAGGGRLTETGLSLGTPHYMSPEQFTGDHEIDARTDVYALGCVLYEMLAGEPPFPASTAQATLAKVLTSEAPSITAIRRSVPLHVDSAIATALEKLPADRFASASELGAALEDETFTHGRLASMAAVFDGRGSRDGSVPWSALFRDWRFVAGLAGSAVIAMGVTMAVRGASDEPSPVVTRAVWIAEGGPGPTDSRNFGISNDGNWIAWTAGLGTGAKLYVRRAHELSGTPVAGSEGAADLVFSPESDQIAFFANGELKRVPVTGGPPFSIASPGFLPSDWTEDGMIWGDDDGRVLRVSADGGVPEVILESDSTIGFPRFPELLPGGRALLFTSFSETSQIRVLDMISGEVLTLVDVASDAHYLPTGHLVYGHPDQVLLAVRFDARRLEVTGEPTSVIDPVNVNAGGIASVAVSENGTLLYQARGAGDVPVEAVLLDGRGNEEALPVLPSSALSPRFSPNGQYISYTDGYGNGGDVFVYSLASRTASQLTFEGINQWAIWSADGAFIAFSSARADTQGRDVYRVRRDVPGSEERLFRAPNAQHPQSWSSDGRLIFRENTTQRGFDLRIATPSGDSFAITDYLTERWDEMQARISPDGRWAAYVSDQNGTREVYVRAFPTPGAALKISVDGGDAPVWAPDGVSLYYMTPANDLVVAALQIDSAVTLLERRVVLQAPRYHRTPNSGHFDVHPDGDRFVMLMRTGETRADDSREMIIVTNWFEELRQRMGEPAR